MGLLTKIIKSRKLSKTKPSANKIYSPDIETLWNALRQLYDKRIELDSKFSFNEMAFEISKLLNKKFLPSTNNSAEKDDRSNPTLDRRRKEGKRKLLR